MKHFLSPQLNQCGTVWSLFDSTTNKIHLWFFEKIIIFYSSCTLNFGWEKKLIFSFFIFKKQMKQIKNIVVIFFPWNQCYRHISDFFSNCTLPSTSWKNAYCKILFQIVVIKFHLYCLSIKKNSIGFMSSSH